MSEWISLNDKWPNDNQHVVLARVYDFKDDEGNEITPSYAIGYAWYDYEFDTGEKRNVTLEFIDEHDEVFDDYFTHWMPLTEPKEETK